MEANDAFDLSDDDLEAALSATDGEAGPDAEATSEGDNTAPPPPDQEQPEQKQDDGPGDLRVALQQERERRRLVEEERQRQAQELAAYQQYVQQLTAQQQQAQQPEEAPDWFEDPNAAFQHHIRPIQAENQELKAYVGKLEEERQLFLFSQQPGKQDAPQLVRYFDEAMPHMAHLGIEEKYLMTKGAMFADPAYVEQMVNERVQAKLSETLAKQANPSTQGPVSIGHVSSSTSPSAGKAPSAMSDAELEAMLRGQ